MHPVSNRVFGPTLSLFVLVRFLACSQLVDGLALQSGLADARGSSAFGGLGKLERALPVLRRLSRSPRKGCGQALPIAFAKEAVGDDCRSGRGRAVFGLSFQGMGAKDTTGVVVVNP